MKKINSHIGVSEVIGFVMILGIMITGIGLVVLYGYPILLEQQANANVRNMERNMIVLQTDINSLVFKSVPYKETTMQVSGGTLSVIPPDPYPINPMSPAPGNRPEFVITYQDPSNPVAFLTVYFYPGELRYEPDSQDAVVEYENGNVHKRYWNTDGSTTLSNPRWFIDDNAGFKTLVITPIQITTEDLQTLSKNGISTVRMKVDPITTFPYPIDVNYGPLVTDQQSVTVVYNPDMVYNYEDTWRNYFTQFTDNTLPGTNSLKVDVNRLVIKPYQVTVQGL
jgi:hypothetical protein